MEIAVNDTIVKDRRFYSPVPVCEAVECRLGTYTTPALSEALRQNLAIYPWGTKRDFPLYALNDKMVLATDGELQWVYYERRGVEWKSFGYPTSRDTVRRRLPLDTPAEVVEMVGRFPDHFSHHFREVKAAPPKQEAGEVGPFVAIV